MRGDVDRSPGSGAESAPPSGATIPNEQSTAASSQGDDGGPNPSQGNERPADPPSQQAAASAICPYLEVAGGRWRQASPSRDHRCTALWPPAPLTVGKQRRLCLGPAHEICPAFLAAADARLAWSGLPIAAIAGPGTVPRPPEIFANRWGLTRTAPIVFRPAGRGSSVETLGQQRTLAQAGLVAALLVAFAAIVASRLPGGAGFGGALLAATPTASPQAATPTPQPSVASLAPATDQPATTPPATTPIPLITAPPTAATATAAATLPSTATPAPTVAATTHRVVVGDTLSGIAARYRTTVQAIRDLNGLTSTIIRVGQVLKIPPAAG